MESVLSDYPDTFLLMIVVIPCESDLCTQSGPDTSVVALLDVTDTRTSLSTYRGHPSAPPFLQPLHSFFYKKGEDGYPLFELLIYLV